MIDKFYTRPNIAKSFVEELAERYVLSTFSIIEPSAGSGDIYKELKKYSPNVFAIDIEPDSEAIQKQDFFSFCPVEQIGIVCGNPPFGKNSSLAIKFFNKAASLNPEVIAFILPRTFKKPRFWKHLSKNYSLVWTKDCPKHSFYYNEDLFDVPCCMQIWNKKRRPTEFPEELCLLRPDKDGSLFVRRAGGRAGRIVDTFTPSSTYRLKDSERVREILNNHADEFNLFAENTAGVKSITLLEMEDIIFRRYDEDIVY